MTPNISKRRSIGRPIDPYVDETVLDALEFLLERFGWRSTSVDRLARHAGIARTTIYRRWGDIEGVALMLLRRTLRAGLVEPSAGAFADDADDLARQVASRWGEAPGLCSAIAAMERDSPAIREAYQMHMTKDHHVLERVAERAHARGELQCAANGVHALTMLVFTVERLLADDPQALNDDALHCFIGITVAGAVGTLSPVRDQEATHQ